MTFIVLTRLRGGRIVPPEPTSRSVRLSPTTCYPFTYARAGGMAKIPVCPLVFFQSDLERGHDVCFRIISQSFPLSAVVTWCGNPASAHCRQAKILGYIHLFSVLSFLVWDGTRSPAAIGVLTQTSESPLLLGLQGTHNVPSGHVCHSEEHVLSA